ncbi:cytochrome c biogenesis CcdA family protein [Hyphomicrobium sp.]|uniref:cytochrome c biogenesis CcdA family protein n=1 Tax=Hyphomicrobium sp. TaxID=82 RepID=UPI002E360871|nr:cytochrome c biogenesis protein CcdA [Hyphomicrobium sp.]HEX2843428.1 cytochrome c biogenesis protein CcdA [Hyphomicrobium sp.]
MTIGALMLAALAGALSVLSPCVLPLLPIVLGAAAAEHRWAPAALALGVALSFTVLGLFVATIGFAVGLDAALFRTVAAVLLLSVGVVLLVQPLQVRLAAAGSPISNTIEETFGQFSTAGVGGQFVLGLLLGAVWAPCVGPTLGAASVLAARGEDLGQVAATMAVFGIGAAIPLLLLGLLSREAMLRWRGRLLDTGSTGKAVLGLLLIAVAFLILTGLDKSVEAALVEASPAWLTDLTTRL